MRVGVVCTRRWKREVVWSKRGAHPGRRLAHAPPIGLLDAGARELALGRLDRGDEAELDELHLADEMMKMMDGTNEHRCVRRAGRERDDPPAIDATRPSRTDAHRVARGLSHERAGAALARRPRLLKRLIQPARPTRVRPTAFVDARAIDLVRLRMIIW